MTSRDPKHTRVKSDPGINFLLPPIHDSKNKHPWAPRLPGDDPAVRNELPWFKDPTQKYGLWSIIKDNIGKDLTRITMPVYWNDPTSLS